MTEAGQFGLALAIGAFGIGFWMAIVPLAKAWAIRISGGATGVADLEARIAALEARSPVTGETEAVYHRVAELEERLDFTERMLAQSRPEVLLPPAEGR